MRKYNFVVICSCFSRSISSSDEGSNYGWNFRDLRERRELALKYMGNIKLRAPVHEGIRNKVHLDRKFSDDTNLSSLMKTNYVQNSCAAFENFDDCIKDVLNLAEECEDCSKFVFDTDLPLLKDEFTHDSYAEQATVRNWLKFRNESVDYQNYLSIPESERTSWSAWYLRNIKAPSDR